MFSKQNFYGVFMGKTICRSCRAALDGRAVPALPRPGFHVGREWKTSLASRRSLIVWHPMFAILFDQTPNIAALLSVPGACSAFFQLRQS